jgi:protein SCO1/2
MSRTARFVALGVAVAVIVVAAVIIVAGGRTKTYAFKGGEIAPAQSAPPLNLTDHNGQSFTLDRLKGSVVVVYFGYTTCPDLCPTTLSDFTAVKASLGDDAARVRFVLVTVDPERDSAARLKEYLGFFDPDFIGLRGDNQQIETVKQAYGVIATRVEYPNSATGYLVDHTSLVYVVDTDGRLRLTYAYGTDPADITEDLRHLI